MLSQTNRQGHHCTKQNFDASDSTKFIHTLYVAEELGERMAVETIGGDPSMIQMLEEQGKTIENHGEAIDKLDQAVNNEIFPRLEILEREQLQFKQEMLNVQKGQKDLEVTVMKDGKETRELLKPFADHALKQMEFDAQTKKEIAIKKLDNKDKATVALYGAIGSGGVVTIIAGFFALFK